MEPKQGQAQQMPQQAVPPQDQEVLVPLAEISFAPFLEQDRFHPESIPRQP